MNEQRFSDLAAAYGGELSRWPGAERGRAQAFAASHGEVAAGILRESSALDRVLSSAPVAVPHAAFVAQALQGALDGAHDGAHYGGRTRASAGAWAQVRGWVMGSVAVAAWRPAAAAFAALAVIGFAAGWASGPLLLDTEADDVFASISYDGASYFTLEDADG